MTVMCIFKWNKLIWICVWNINSCILKQRFQIHVFLPSSSSDSYDSKEYLWMNTTLAEEHKKFSKYNVFVLYLFIERYKYGKIKAIKSFAKVWKETFML